MRAALIVCLFNVFDREFEIPRLSGDFLFLLLLPLRGEVGIGG